ncbi:MAG: hypothetical protein SVZ03_13810 [Spirochaetota bacterium]|nr:hypothetical protein [Spirochaetota bacterium]
MSMIKNAGQMILNLSDRVVRGTERYSKIAKLTVDIKRSEDDIEKTQKKIGEYIIEKMDSGTTSFDSSDQFIGEHAEKIREYRRAIQTKREEINEIRKEAKPDVNDSINNKTENKIDDINP